MMKHDNPEMTDALLRYGRQSMKANGIVDSSDAADLGLGAMTAARWAAFYEATQEEGLYPKGLDITRAYTLDFVNHKTAMKPQ